ncbi:MAG TPA: hypothetical protein VN876_03970 [Gemmatimonadaceae bacterium]|nr:hypothetical protein [Gemmatimonadaceae bacterium]
MNLPRYRAVTHAPRGEFTIQIPDDLSAGRAARGDEYIKRVGLRQVIRAITHIQKMVACRQQDSCRATCALSPYHEESLFPIANGPPGLGVRAVEPILMHALDGNPLQTVDVVYPIGRLEVDFVMPGGDCTGHRRASGKATLLRQRAEFLVC